MKKHISIFIVITIFCSFFVSAVDVHVSEDNNAITSIVLEYEETVTTVGAGGEEPYGFFEASCVSLKPIDGVTKADYTADSSDDTCYASIIDGNYWGGTIEFCVTSCPCSGCAPCTEDAMDSDDDEVIIVPMPHPGGSEEGDPICGHW